MAHETVTLVLITADNCVGIQQFNRDESGKTWNRPMRWIGEPDAQTREAIIEDVSGNVVTMDGDMWRRIEENGRIGVVLYEAFSSCLNKKRLKRLARAA